MAIPEQDHCEFLGWALIDLDDPIPKQTYKVAERLGIQIEDFIDEALKEKLERMEERQDYLGAPSAQDQSQIV